MEVFVFFPQKKQFRLMEGIQMAQTQPQVVLVYDSNHKSASEAERPYRVKRTIQTLYPSVRDYLSVAEVENLMVRRISGNRTYKVVIEGK